MAAADVLEFSSPKERAEELIRFLGASDDNLQHALGAVLAAGSFADLIGAVLQRQADVFKAHSDEDVEGVFKLMLSLLSSVPPGEQDGVIDRIVAAVTSTSDKALLRLRIVTDVYNFVDEVQHKDSKLGVLKALIRYAADHRQLELLQPYLAGAATWPAKWQLSPEQAGALYLLIAQSLEKTGAAEDAQAFLIRYLTTLETASEAAQAGARAWAKTAALNFVMAPAVSQKSNLARLAAVRALAKDAEHGRLYELVDIFAHATLSAYLAYHARNAQYLAELGVDHERSVETMRLLTLCSLAAADHVVAYDAIATALQVRVDEVEGWVVKAITAGLVDARMDQQAQTVTVTRSVQRDFSHRNWVELKGRLDQWSGNIQSMLRALEEAR